MDSVPPLFSLLACPVHRTPLEQSVPERLRCPDSCEYPIIEGVPYLIAREQADPADEWVQSSLRYRDDILAGREDPRARDKRVNGVDQHVQVGIESTNSRMYRPAIGKLTAYPIPRLPMAPAHQGARLLDIGCNWGRWCFAAERAGFSPIGIDPSLNAALAATRIARQLGSSARFVVADARHLPFRPGAYDAAWSYSVLQHFAKDDVHAVMRELAGVIKPGGVTKLHLLNRYGLRSLQVQAVRAFRKPFFFQTRYWSPREMLSAAEAAIGPSSLEVDGYFMQGRPEDRHLFNAAGRALVAASEALKRLRLLDGLADNLFVVSRRA